MTSIESAEALRPARSTTTTLRDRGDVQVAVDDIDRTRPFLLLHGGGGPMTMTGFAHLLAERTHARVLLPTHPGFAGTARSESLASTRDLALAYVELIEERDLADLTLIGNSFGGWLAAEIALLHSPRVSGVVIVDGVGLQVTGHPPTDVRGLTPDALAALSFHDPAKSPAARAAGSAGPSPDVQALVAYAGATMTDPTLESRLADIDLPVHVLWGESDGIVDVDYGKAYAAAIPGSTFTLLPRTGHLPQVETPEELLDAILDLGRS
ncbi:alpha/beta fold hydrolase [Allobranchiibius sp. CTAmp26]|uniref:alpha/beta fold hydrolase n=1 Tax=Allobranchiibius sp. CTAmp26 TaxID=2815214 RepID=UPI001AA15EF8|nr:alpha/beta hydrolase [Allobranchiibius sp. CTAmp26]MBO1755046.1 alpha/beta hydrolase [Allobranchiibius sp. CTAmp26]